MDILPRQNKRILQLNDLCEATDLLNNPHMSMGMAPGLPCLFPQSKSLHLPGKCGIFPYTQNYKESSRCIHQHLVVDRQNEGHFVDNSRHCFFSS